jgi:dienelactone hydrolase
MRWALAAVCLSSGCLTLDSFIYNGIHCTRVSEETCTAYESPFDNVCVPCDEPYDWARDYDWFDVTLEEGQTIRPIDVTTVQQQTLATADGLGQLDTYFVPAHGDDPVLATVTMVYNHGNYASIEHYLPRVRMLHEAGYNVLVWDFRGYGKSMPETTASPEQFLSDARQVLDLAVSLAPDPERIISYGYSVGGIPAVEMAVTNTPCAHFHEAAFTSMESIATSTTTTRFGENFFSEGLYDNIEKIKSFQGAVLVMQGTLDNKWTMEDARAFLAAAPGPKAIWELEGVHHGIATIGVPEAGFTAYTERMRRFLEEEGAACLGED